MSCSKSNPTVPGDESISNLKKLREMLWTEGDHTISEQALKERRVDVSNVILGREYTDTQNWTNGQRGYILTHEDDLPSAQDPVELVVVTWSEMDSMSYDGGTYYFWNVYFKVLAFDENDNIVSATEYTLENLQWNPGAGCIPAIQNYPCVTAHISDVDPSNDEFEEPKLIVDIAYQRGCQWGDYDNWSVCHVQYRQDENDPDVYDALVKVSGPNTIAPYNPETEWAIHPDIVIGTYFRIDPGPPPIVYNIDWLMVVFEVIEKETSAASVVYRQCPSWRTDDLTFGWGELEYVSILVIPGSEEVIPQYPRIDAGIDCSDPLVPNPQFYIAAVVWHSVYDTGQFLTSKLYFNYKPFNVPEWGQIFQPNASEFDSFDTTACPNGLPYVEVDPLENLLEGHCPENYTHMVWSRFMNPAGTDIEPYYTNSELVMQHWWEPGAAIRKVYDGGQYYREGLTTISTYSDQADNDPYDRVGTIQFISAPNGSQEYPVYSVDLWYINEDPQDPDFSQTIEPVSDSGNSSSDEFPWECGPSSAMRGGDVTFCAWTKKFQQDQPPLLIYDIISDQDL